MQSAQSAVVNILVNVNNAQAQASYQATMQILVAASDRATKQMSDNAAKAAQASALSFSSLFGADFFAKLAADGVKSFMSIFTEGISNVTLYAARTEELGVALAGIAKVNNLNTQSIRDQEKALKDANIATQTAREALIKFINAGLPLQQVNPLASVAKDLAVIAGVSSSEELDRLINGITTLQVRVLRTAGVYVSLNEEEKKYAKQNGVTVASLSTQQKQQIALNAVLEFGARAQGLYTDAMTTTSKQLRSLERQQQEFSDAIGGTFIPILGVLVQAYGGMLDIFTKSPAIFFATIAALTALTIATIAAASGLATMTAAQIANAASGSIVVKALQAVVTAMYAVATGAEVTAGTLIIATAGFAAIGIAIGIVIAAIDTYMDAQTVSNKITLDLIATQGKQLEMYQGLQADTRALTTSFYSLAQGQSFSSQKHDELNKILSQLDPTTRTYISLLSGEQKQISALTEEINKNIEARTNSAKAEATSIAIAGGQDFTQIQSAKSQQSALTKQINGGFFSQSFSNQIDQVLRSGNENKDFDELQRDTNQQLAASYNTLTDSIEGPNGLNNAFNEQVKKLDALQKQTGMNNTEYANFILKVTGSQSETDALTTGIVNLRNAQNSLAQATTTATNALAQQIQALDEAANATERSKGIKAIGETMAELFKSHPQDIGKGIKALTDNDPVAKQQIEDQKGYNKALQEFNKLIDITPAKTHAAKTEVESLSKSVSKLRADIASFNNPGSAEFQLRFQKEDLERVKRDYEQILNLRHELGLPLATPLPQGAIATREELANLNAIKGVRDELIKTAREQTDAEIKLAETRLKSEMAVVDARTIADTAYFDNIRKRREAEQQLSADIVTEIRKRADAETNAARAVATAQAQAYKEFLSEKNTSDDQRIQTLSKAQAYLGQSFAGNPLVQLAQSIASAPKAETSPVLSRLDTSNDLLQKIYDSVKHWGGDGASATPFTGSGSVDYSGAPSKRARQVLQNVLAPSKFDNQIAQAAAVVSKETGVDSDSVALMLKATLYRESSGVGGLISNQNARGYYQQLPGTSKLLGVKDPNNFLDAAIGAGRYLTRGLSANDASGGYLAGGLPEAFATYFAGEGGGKRGTKTAGYVRDQVYVYNQAMNALHGGAKATPSGQPITGMSAPAASDLDFSKSLDTLRELTPLTEKFFDMKADDKRITIESANAMLEYGKAQRTALEQGTKGLQDNAVGQDKIKKAIDYQITSVGALAVSESNLEDIQKRRATAVLPLLRQGQISRNLEQTTAENQIVTGERYLQLLDRQDEALNKYLDSLFKASIITGSTQAATENQNNLRFLQGYANKDPNINRLLSEQFNAGQSGNLRTLTTDVDTQRRLAQTGNRNSAAESLQLEKDRLTTINAVGAAEAKLAENRQLYADQEVTQARQSAAIITERTDLETQLVQIEDKRATAPINQALRERVAVEQELLNIQQADLDAQTKIATLQVDIADKTVYHQKQATEQVLEHLNQVKSLTDIYAQSKIIIVDGVFGGIDKLMTKISGKIPIISDLLNNLLSGITKLFLTPLLANLLNIPLNGTQSQTAGQSGGGILGGIGSIFDLFKGGGSGSSGSSTAPFNPNAPSYFTGTGSGSSNPFGFSFGSGGGSSRPDLSFLQPLLSQSAQTGQSDVLTNLIAQQSGNTNLHELGNNIGGAASSAGKSVLGNLNLSNLLSGVGFGQKAGSGGALAGILPLLGASLGAQVGGGGFNSIISGAGGALLGIGLTAAPTALAGTFLAPLFSNPITAVVGGALLVGALILKRNSLRRKEEEQRTAILTDSKSQLNQILADMRGGKIDGATAASQADTVRANYLTQVGQLTDTKTRTIAQQVVRELDSIISQIKTEGSLLDKKRAYADAFDNAIVPTFDSGGVGQYVQTMGNMGVFTGSGGQSYGDIYNARVKRNEVVLTPQNIANLGGLAPLQRAGVLGISQYQNAYLPRANNSGGNGSDQPIYNVIVADEEAAQTLFKNVSGKAILKKSSLAVFNGDDGGQFVKLLTKRQQGK